ncbi:hypothetical protein HK15_13070 [Acetobacter orientalis]|uniref:Polymer-forming cytoskeletal protein n=1 Tax=Acetobacter orientalis TaxID=146474 RepID=A0A252B3C5_9PROT|nr:hypothetical protein HK15_13070 [Acetobacter orientalis]
METPSGRKLHRIRALVAIAEIGVSVGDFGGFIEASKNLEQSGNARVYGDAWVYGDARVYGNALVYGNAQVSGNAWVSLSIHIGWFSNVGSERGTLTYFRQKDGSVCTNRGCFSGTLSDFEGAVKKRHGDSRIGQEYDLLIQFIRLRASAWEVAQQEAA